MEQHQRINATQPRGMPMHEYATPEELNAEIGSQNWVVARRTSGIVSRYGKDVVCLTPRQFQEAETRALEKRRARLLLKGL